MNEFFKLLRDFIIFIPLGILIFGIFFSLIAAAQQNLSFLLVGLIIFLYGLAASYVRQIYKDLVNFLRKKQLGNSQYLSMWKKYHLWYYFVQFILLVLFIFVLWYFLLQQTNESLLFPQVTFSSGIINFDLDTVTAIAQIVSAFFVGLSLLWVAKTTKATEKLVENQIMPSVDLNMIHDKGTNKTYFWFLNASKIPALVSITTVINNKSQRRGLFRIHPHHPQIFHFKRTAANFDFIEGNAKKEVTLKITVRPAVDNEMIEPSSFTKNYRFNETTKEWDETTWSFPDLPFPEQK